MNTFTEPKFKSVSVSTWMVCIQLNDILLQNQKALWSVPVWMGQTFSSRIGYWNWHPEMALGYHAPWKRYLWWVWMTEARFWDSLSRLLGEATPTVEPQHTRDHRPPEYLPSRSLEKTLLKPGQERATWINERYQLPHWQCCVLNNLKA